MPTFWEEFNKSFSFDNCDASLMHQEILITFFPRVSQAALRAATGADRVSLSQEFRGSCHAHVTGSLNFNAVESRT